MQLPYLVIESNVFGDSPLGWRFYVDPFIRSMITFILVLLVSALVLRLVHRRRVQSHESVDQ